MEKQQVYIQFLQYINSVEKNIMTLEDPVEYELSLIRQTSVREGVIAFGSGIKSLLRQDPDIIFVGEVRDEETASSAIRAAMTGHQVFTTLHTNNAVGAIARLIDIGVKPFLLSTSLIACLAQRLVRILCSHCKKAKEANSLECQFLSIKKDEKKTIYEAVGCNKCYNSGFKGRCSVVEILVISNPIGELIATSATTNTIVDCAKKEGFISMDNDAIEKVKQGITSIKEIIRTIDMTHKL